MRNRADALLAETADLANPLDPWDSSDVIRDSHLPRRRLIFAGTSPSLWFVYYELGGYSLHDHLMIIGKDPEGGYWVRWVTSQRPGHLGHELADLQSSASTGTLQTTEHSKD